MHNDGVVVNTATEQKQNQPINARRTRHDTHKILATCNCISGQARYSNTPTDLADFLEFAQSLFFGIVTCTFSC